MNEINMDLDKPLVIISCTTYNQKLYIRQCLDGFIMQQTTFPFYAVVHDDASTDGTADIVREYAEKYPDIIHPIFETENQYSKQDGSIQRIMFNACKSAKYIAICEGDDYWTDKLKLQRQVDFLEEHEEYSASTENGLVYFTDNQTSILFSEENTRDISFDELLIKRRFPTASVVYRSKYLNGIARLKLPLFDTLYWAYFATQGKIHFNAIVSSVYNRGCGITSADKIRWAYVVRGFNMSLNANFVISDEIKTIRNEDVYKNIINGILEAKRQKRYLDVIKLSYYGMQIHPKRMIKWIIIKILRK